MPGCGSSPGRATLTQGEARRQPLPLSSPRWILTRTRGSEATGPTRCGSWRWRSSRQLRRADQSAAPSPAAGSSPGRPTLTQGEAQRQPLPLPSPRWILSRTRGSEATRPTRCGSERRRSSRQLRRADQDGAPCPAAGSSPGGPRWPRAKRSGSPCLFPPRAGSSPGRAAARPTGPGAADQSGSRCALFFRVRIKHRKKQNDT